MTTDFGLNNNPQKLSQINMAKKMCTRSSTRRAPYSMILWVSTREGTRTERKLLPFFSSHWSAYSRVMNSKTARRLPWIAIVVNRFRVLEYTHPFNRPRARANTGYNSPPGENPNLDIGKADGMWYAAKSSAWTIIDCLTEKNRSSLVCKKPLKLSSSTKAGWKNKVPK